MCIIAICKTRRLTNKELTNCFNNNHHGAGVAWFTKKDGLCFRKGFMKLKDLKAFYECGVPLPHILHFRIGTNGGNTALNTHPFLVDESSPLKIGLDRCTVPLLFHNGVFTNYVKMFNFLKTKVSALANEKCEQWVDSRVMAAMLAKYPEMTPDMFDYVSRWVIAYPTGEIRIYGNFEKVDGVLFSNSSYKEERILISSPRQYYYSKDYYSKDYTGSCYSKPVSANFVNGEDDEY